MGVPEDEIYERLKEVQINHFQKETVLVKTSKQSTGIHIENEEDIKYLPGNKASVAKEEKGKTSANLLDNEAKLIDYLLNFGYFDDKKRAFIYRKILKIPYNEETYKNI
jgi:hypothetical protein